MRILIPCLLALSLLISGPLPAQAGTPAALVNVPGGQLDTITFGDVASEQAHGLTTGPSTVVDGALGQKARVAQPYKPAKTFLGELRFTAAVDPAKQNYLSLKLWGEDVSSYKTLVLVNGEAVSYRNNGDYEPINVGTGVGLKGRFFVTTTMLPLPTTQGRSTVEVTLRTYHPSLTSSATEISRRYYQAITHTEPRIELPGTGYTPSPQAAPALTSEQEQAYIDKYEAQQVTAFNALTAKNPMSIVRYQDELRFYAEALRMTWSPAKTPEQKKAALRHIFDSIDAYTKQYYGNVKSLGNGGHQSDWGGYYSALGEALYIVDDLIDQYVPDFDAYLDQPFATGTTDGPNSIADGPDLTRRKAWERVLKANFDFARTRLSYIYNQVFYCYEGAWKAHEGLRVIGSKHYEGKARSHAILLEALGAKPFLGEEVLVGPDGEDLDLYHSLFQHDRNAVYNDDYLQIVMKGLAKSKLDRKGDVVRRLPYGEHYTGITKDGLTRENGYVALYGESANYLPAYFYRTLGQQGDEELGDEIIKLALRSVHARGYLRYQGTDANGNRAMLLEQVIDERSPGYPGRIGYSTDLESGPRPFSFASLEHHMVTNPGRYRGKDWAIYKQYAREAVGYLQQQLVDNRMFPTFDAFVLPQHKTDLRLGATWAYVTKQRGPAAVVLPHTDLARYTDAELARLGIDRGTQPARFAWVDLDNLVVSARDGQTHLIASLNERARGYTGNGRIHAQYPGFEQLAQIASQAELTYRDYTLRSPSAEDPAVYDRYPTPEDRPLALAGELAPISHQPGVGAIRRDNWNEDNPYSGYPDLVTARYGDYLFAVNTTRKEYGNSRSFTIPVSGHDLVTGKDVRRPRLAPGQAAVVITKDAAPATPAAVDVVVATPGSGATGLTWRPAAGAESYTITRDGKTIAKNVTGTSFVDQVRSGKHTYRVTAVNQAGDGPSSTPISAHITKDRDREGRQVDRIGQGTRGEVKYDGDAVTFQGVAATGFGKGDDSIVHQRDETDSLVMSSTLARGATSLQARIGQGAGGVILRDSVAPKARYVYLGGDGSGGLVLATRSLDTRADIGVGKPGQNAGGGYTRSPISRQITGGPYVKLVRTGYLITALVSPDGQTWTRAAEVALPMVDVVHAGVAATGDARLSKVAISSLPEGGIQLSAAHDKDAIALRWNKPADVVAFEVYRDGQAITDRAFRLAHTDARLRAVTATYKVVGYRFDGTTVESAPVVATVEAPEAALARAKELKAEDWTKGSFYLLTKELARIEPLLNDPAQDRAKLTLSIYAAVDALVSATQNKIDVLGRASVIASHPFWDNAYPVEVAGTFAFDGDVNTYVDLITRNGTWFQADFGQEPVRVGHMRMYPRTGANNPTKLENAQVMGSDDGTSWTQILKVTGTGEIKWYSFATENTQAWRYIRWNGPAGSSSNIAELELYPYWVDHSLVEALLAEVAELKEAGYTADSWAKLTEAADAARATADGTQSEVDAAAETLRGAIASLGRSTP